MTRPQDRAWSKLFVSAQRLESWNTPETARRLSEGTLSCRALLDPALDPRALSGGVLSHLMRLTGAVSGAIVVDEPRLAVSSEGKPLASGLERHAVEYVHHTGFSVSVPAEGERGPLACVPLVRPDGPLVRGVVLLQGAPGQKPHSRADLELAYMLGRQLVQALHIRTQRAEGASRREAAQVVATARKAAETADRAAQSAAASAQRAERAAHVAKHSSSTALRAGTQARRAAAASVKAAALTPTAGTATPAPGTPRAPTPAPGPPKAAGKHPVSSPTLTLWVAVGDSSRGSAKSAAPLTLDNVFTGTTPSLGWLDEEQ